LEGARLRDHELLLKAKDLPCTIRIGKNGVTDRTIDEINRALRKKKMVKIKILQNCQEDKDKVFDAVAAKTGSILLQKIGKVFTLYKNKI
jgi:RNA-binding protein